MEASSKVVQHRFQQASLHGIQTYADTESPPSAPEFDCHTSGLCQAYPDVSPVLSKMLIKILITPRFSGSVVAAIIYGYDTIPGDDPFVSKAIHIGELVLDVVTAERVALFSAFPICKFTHVPYRTS